MIIALAGYATSGKDTVADILVEHRGFVKYAWADTLRLAAAALDPIVWVGMDGEYLRYTQAIELCGYNDAKFLYPELRQVLQRIGTEVGRNLIGENVWVDATLLRIGREQPVNGNVVIADTRFPNEADAVKKLGADNRVVRVARTHVGPQSDHPSEISLDDYDFDWEILNSGTVDDLTKKVLAWHDSLEIAA
jgi:ribosomal protein S16